MIGIFFIGTGYLKYLFRLFQGCTGGIIAIQIQDVRVYTTS